MCNFNVDLFSLCFMLHLSISCTIYGRLLGYWGYLGRSNSYVRTHTIQNLWLHVVQEPVWLQQRSEACPRILCMFLMPSGKLKKNKTIKNHNDMINSRIIFLWPCLFFVGFFKFFFFVRILTSAISTLRSHSLTLFCSWLWDSLTLMYCRTCGTW